MAWHDWSMFRRFRAGIFGLASLIGLSLAVMSIIKLVNGWTEFSSPQRTAVSFLLCINLVSSISLILMLFFPFRPVADMVRVSIVSIFQIGITAVYMLAIDSLPCISSDVVTSCKTLNRLLYAGAMIFCILLFIYIVGLTPNLKQPLISGLSSPDVHRDFKRPYDQESVSASTLTYASWDRVPEKTRESALPPYSKGFADSYYYSLQSKPVSPPRPRRPSLSKSPMMMPNPFLTPESGIMELGKDEPLRPFTPMEPVSRTRRASASSFNSVSSRKSSDSDLAELKRAVIAPETVPYAELVRRGSGESSMVALPRGAQAPRVPPQGDLLPPPVITLTDADLIETRKSIVPSRVKDDGAVIPHRVKRKAPPQQLSLGNHLEFLQNDAFESAVPRSPSPITPGTGRGSLFPVTPNSGALPSHPRLTMHFRELTLARGQGASGSTQPGFRALTRPS